MNKSETQTAVELICGAATSKYLLARLQIALQVMAVTPSYEHEKILKAIFGMEEKADGGQANVLDENR